jgi:hypothetical protein
MDPIVAKVVQRVSAEKKIAPVDWVMDEVITQRHKGEILQKRIAVYLKEVVRLSQAIHEDVEEAYIHAKKNVDAGEDVTREHLLKAVEKAVGESFGLDPLGKQLARAIALGENVF